jgi:hypothetical protein
VADLKVFGDSTLLRILPAAVIGNSTADSATSLTAPGAQPQQKLASAPATSQGTPGSGSGMQGMVQQLHHHEPADQLHNPLSTTAKLRNAVVSGGGLRVNGRHRPIVRVRQLTRREKTRSGLGTNERHCDAAEEECGEPAWLAPSRASARTHAAAHAWLYSARVARRAIVCDSDHVPFRRGA